MDHEILERLRHEHCHFERIFSAIEAECSRLEVGITANIERLKSIVAYLGKYAFPAHHALEDAIFEKLEQHVPLFRQDIFDLTEDHEISRHEFSMFSNMLNATDSALSDAGRSFVANERGHFISEEEIFFKYALKHLAPSQWSELQQRWPCERVDLRAVFPLIEDLLD